MDILHSNLRQELIYALENYSDDILKKYLSQEFIKNLKSTLERRDYCFINNFFDELENIQHKIAPTGDVLELEEALENAKELKRIKIKLGIDGLRCYCDDIYGSNPVVFLTEEEASMIDRHPKRFREIKTASEIDLISSNFHTLKLMCTGNIYSHLDDLRHDWLAYKLSGLDDASR